MASVINVANVCAIATWEGSERGISHQGGAMHLLPFFFFLFFSFSFFAQPVSPCDY
ncbi:hypothetical protein CGRA01v4_12734 [Colletotrichum graminicola]|nr:hypothetical protein CGRA01v4_12734 [Colletotrichum graminicola]